ncbi:MAG: hypothetical protein WC301_06520 [Candidatus Omnitrophota bacterium]|jgi:hypothetical protein
MKNKYIYKKGMGVMEYILVIAVVVAALVGMQVYIKRAISGRIRQGADTFGYGRQYDAPEMKIWEK